MVFMKVQRTIQEMRSLSARWRRAGRRIGLVPTMGYLHEGHLSLVDHARQRLGRGAKVVVSVFVNPTQFAATEDLAQYPRDLPRDLALCRGRRVDAVFVPESGEMYPSAAGAGAYSTFVTEESLSRTMEGASRPTHFRGVTTVVAKLFNIAQPDLAVFGAKDWQQAAVVRRMARDLNFPLDIIVAPTMRESDGLAMSSRNRYLEGDLRRQATVLWRAIELARARVGGAHGPLSAARLKGALERLIQTQPDARLDYVEFFDPDSLVPASRISAGCHLALAVFIGKTRLIDNARL